MLVEQPGSRALAISAITTSYTSLIMDGEAELGEAVALEYASAQESEFHLNNCR